MKFSILIANYNNGRFFKDCYESIIGQSFTNWEAVIVDDRSTDDSVAIIMSLIKDDTRFTLYENEVNKGCGYTKRKCVEMANGEICGFVDPDDAIMPSALQVMIQAHINFPNVSLVHSTFYFCDEDLKVTSKFLLAKEVKVNDRFLDLDGEVTHFSSFKKIFYDQTDGIHPRLDRAVDKDLYMKLSEKGAFHFINEPLYKYRIHRNGIASASSVKAFYCHLKVILLAEERRNLNFENEVEPYLNGTRKTILYYESNLNNPKFIVRRGFEMFKHHPLTFLKKLFS